jgi:hypothetical protein
MLSNASSDGEQKCDRRRRHQKNGIDHRKHGKRARFGVSSLLNILDVSAKRGKHHGSKHVNSPHASMQRRKTIATCPRIASEQEAMHRFLRPHAEAATI